MINLDDIEYSSSGLSESKHYQIVIAYSDDLKGVVYHAQNKQTGVLEVPFRILSDSIYVLEDLEDKHLESKPEGGNVVSLKEIH